VYTSPWNQKKYTALGIPITVKKGKTAGVGYFDERMHIPKDDYNDTVDLQYLQQDSEEEEN
jgi:hypothetical protein